MKSFFTDGVSPRRRPARSFTCFFSAFREFTLRSSRTSVPVSGEPAGPGGGPVQAPLHLRTGNHHLQRRPQGGLAALQADPHREGKGTRFSTWRQMSHCSDPCREELEGQEVSIYGSGGREINNICCDLSLLIKSDHMTWLETFSNIQIAKQETGSGHRMVSRKKTSSFLVIMLSA